MKNFFYYANLILCIGTAVAWIIQPMVGAMAHFCLGTFQIINAIVYLVEVRKFTPNTRKMFRWYGLMILLFIVVGIGLTASRYTDGSSSSMSDFLVIALMLGSGVLAVFFSYVTYLAKKEVSSKFADVEDEILDSDLVL